MTKAQIIKELHGVGEVWANESYSKQYLQNYLDNYNKATQMTEEELLALIKANSKLSNA